MSASAPNGRPASGKVVAIVGGGISGIAVSYLLRRRGIASELLEQSDSLGGRIGSCKLGERLLDFGGKNIGRRYRRFREFTAACGDNPYEYFGINFSQVRDGRIVTFDSRRRWSSLLELARRCSRRDLFGSAGCASPSGETRRTAISGRPTSTRSPSAGTIRRQGATSATSSAAASSAR